MRLWLTLSFICVAASDETVININFEGIFQGLGLGPAPAPAPAPEYLPIPNASMGPDTLGTSAYDGFAYYYEEIGSGVYWATNTIYNMMFIVGTNDVWVFDVPGMFVLDAIKAVTNKTISHIVYSHTHNDHIGYTGYFLNVAGNEGRLSNTVVIMGSQASLDHLVKMNDTNRPIPNYIVTGNEMWFSVGNLNISIFADNGIGHLAGSLMTWVPATSTLMAVDIAFPRWAPFFGIGVAADIDTLVPIYNQILSIPFTNFVGGHLGRLGTQADVQQQLDYLNSLHDYAAQANSKYGTQANYLAAFKQVNKWQGLKEVVFDPVSQECYRLLIARWGGVLAAVDVVGPDHCWTMTEHLRIN